MVLTLFQKMSEQQMKHRDERTRLMSELLANIRRCVNVNYSAVCYFEIDGKPCSIKLHAWENAFIRRILTVRNDHELRLLRKIGVTNVRRIACSRRLSRLNGDVQAFSTTLWVGVPMLVAFGSFATAAVTSSAPLTADV